MRVRSVHRASIEAAAAPSSPRRQRVPPVAPPRPVPRRPSPIGTTGSSGTASPGGVMSLAADRGPSAPRHVVSVPCLAPPRARRQRTTLLVARGLNHPFEERAKKTRAMTGVTGRQVKCRLGGTADPAAVHARLWPVEPCTRRRLPWRWRRSKRWASRCWACPCVQASDAQRSERREARTLHCGAHTITNAPSRYTRTLAVVSLHCASSRHSPQTYTHTRDPQNVRTVYKNARGTDLGV